jgi:hypothetical protein
MRTSHEIYHISTQQKKILHADDVTRGDRWGGWHTKNKNEENRQGKEWEREDTKITIRLKANGGKFVYVYKKCRNSKY